MVHVLFGVYAAGLSLGVDALARRRAESGVVARLLAWQR